MPVALDCDSPDLMFSHIEVDCVSIAPSFSAPSRVVSSQQRVLSTVLKSPHFNLTRIFNFPNVFQFPSLPWLNLPVCAPSPFSRSPPRIPAPPPRSRNPSPPTAS